MALLLAVLQVGLAGGCSTTTFDLAHARDSERWIRDRAGYTQRIVYETGPRTVAETDAVFVESTSPTELHFRAAQMPIVPLGQVRQVVAIEHARGAAEGALIGGLSGILLGVVQGASQDLSAFDQSSDCNILCTKAAKEKFDAAIWGSVGLVLGAVIGAAVGYRDVLVLE